MKSSAAYFTHRPLSSYPPEDDDEERQQNEDPGVFAGVLHEPSSAPERLGMWWQQQHRRTKALCGVLVLAVLFAVVGEALYVLVTGLRGVPPGLWSRHGVLTVGKDTPFHIKGASWYGMEHERHCLEGLDKTGLTNVLNELVRQDFNALRIPLALDSFNRDPLVDASSVSTFANPDLSSITYRQLLREVVQRAAERNILIMLDLHRLDSKKWPTDGKWVPEHLGIEGVYSFWRELATEYRDQWNVMGADLFNEPHGAEDWKSWREFVEVTGNMIHTIAPRWLIVAEGVGALKNDPRPRSVFWAENLHPAITDPPVLKERRKVALSPHVYGPSVYNQSYFGASDFPRNMAEIWDDVGSVVSLGIYVVCNRCAGVCWKVLTRNALVFFCIRLCSH